MPTQQEKDAALAAAIAPHPVIEALQNKQILNPLILTGYAGKSEDPKMTRVFRSFGSMSEWTDVATTGIVYAEPGETKLEATTFFIAPEALVTHNDGAQSPRPAAVHANFLRGKIMSQYGHPTAAAFAFGATGTVQAPSVYAACPAVITIHGTPGCHEHPHPHPPSPFCPPPPPPGPTIHSTPGC